MASTIFAGMALRFAGFRPRPQARSTPHGAQARQGPRRKRHAFTRSQGTEADARRLGADRVVLSTDATQMDAVSGQFDLIIDTVPYVHDLNAYLPTLAISGTLVLVEYLGPIEPALNTAPLVLGRKAVAGSVIGGIAETQEMLNFCGEHGITSDIEMIAIDDINHAYERMLKSDVKYRFVIDLASLAAEGTR